MPTLRLRRRRDGTWNLDGLLADPWPGPWIETPPITIQNATLELIPDENRRRHRAALAKSPMAASMVVSRRVRREDSSPLAECDRRSERNRSPAILRDVTLNIEAAGRRPENLKFEGTAGGTPSRR